MPGLFKNISNSGGAKFKNISNSGRGYFYKSTTTTSTTTTTTTGIQVWYTLERCDTLATDYSTNYNTGTFAINDIVVYGGALYFRVTGINYSDPGGTHWSISATGLGACPTTTTTTTTTTIAPITFTAVASCNGLTAEILVNNFAGGTGTYSWIASGSSAPNAFANMNGGYRYAITGPSYTFTNLAVNTTFYIVVRDSGGHDSAAVSVTTPTACTTTSTTTTTTTSGYFTVYLTVNDAGSPCTAGGNLYTKKALVSTITNGTIIYNLDDTTWIPGSGATQVLQWTDNTFTTPLTNIFNFNGTTGTVGTDTGTSC